MLNPNVEGKRVYLTNSICKEIEELYPILFLTCCEKYPGLDLSLRTLPVHTSAYLMHVRRQADWKCLTCCVDHFVFSQCLFRMTLVIFPFLPKQVSRHHSQYFHQKLIPLGQNSHTFCDFLSLLKANQY